MTDPRRAATTTFIGAVAALAVVATAGAFVVYGVTEFQGLAIFMALAALQVVLPEVIVEGRTRMSVASVVQLAAVPILGPAGAAVVSAVLGATQGRNVPRRNRVFNAAALSLVAAVGGVLFTWLGGTADPRRLVDPQAVVLDLAVPLLLVDVVQALVNLLLLAAVLRVALGLPMRAQILVLLRGTGVAYVGFGIIAFILVVLWRAVGLGPASVVVVLAPLLVAQWAYRQHADELQGQQRALEVLVAALEAKAPHLTGHSARVAELSAHMAEGLGLSPQQVADSRMAGMLHDVGQTSLPTRQVRALDLMDRAVQSPYPAAGAALLEDLTFLRGALEPIRDHRAAFAAGDDRALVTQIVALADRYDLLTRVGEQSGRVLEPAAVRANLSIQSDEQLVRALESAVARLRRAEPPE